MDYRPECAALSDLHHLQGADCSSLFLSSWWALIGLWEYFRVTLSRNDSLSALIMKILAYLYVIPFMWSAHHLSTAHLLNSVAGCSG
jgi:hypothetical protein